MPRACSASITSGSRPAAGPGVPSGLAGDLARHDRHERALIGPDLEHQIDQLRPRIAFDVVLDRRARAASARAIVAHILRRDVAPSARGCTVMPGAPAVRRSTPPRRARSACVPPRELRSVATLLTLTLEANHDQSHCASSGQIWSSMPADSASMTQSTRSTACRVALSECSLHGVDDLLRPARGSRPGRCPSSITRSSGSVPE